MALLIGLAAYLSSIQWVENRAFIIHGLCALPFVAIGAEIKKYTANDALRKYKTWAILISLVSIVCWILAIVFSHLEMRACSFGCWPLDIVGACGGTIVLWLIAEYFLKNKKICDSLLSKAIIWCGRYSMAILCMHALEWKALLPLEQVLCDGWLLLLMRFSITISLAIMVVYLHGINKIYR